MFAWIKKEINKVKLQGHLKKITETARLPGMEPGMDNSQYGGYITCL